MEKHYNLKHEILLRTSRSDILDAGKKYTEGEAIKQRERVNYAEYIFNHEERLVKAIINRDMIVDLYNQIMEIESKEYDGIYSELLF